MSQRSACVKSPVEHGYGQGSQEGTSCLEEVCQSDAARPEPVAARAAEMPQGEQRPAPDRPGAAASGPDPGPVRARQPEAHTMPA